MEPSPTPAPTFEEFPLTRMEYITALVHFYRGEMTRANTWRTRLDTTTNWAVLTTGAMLSFAFSAPEHSQVTLLLANLLVAIFLAIEARRFRYFDVWRSRIRMLEENFFIPIILRNLVSPRSDWRRSVAEDLDRPKFKITFLQAVGMRLRRNYLGVFTIILLAWVAKLNLHPSSAGTLDEVVGRMRVGALPGWGMLLLTVGFYLALCVVALWAGGQRGATDEVQGVEKSIDHWKT